jgi:hypothetical protein
LKLFNTSSLEEFSEFFNVNVSASDSELDDTLGNSRLDTLLLRVELDLVFNLALNVLLALLLESVFKFLNIIKASITENTASIVFSKIDDTFTLCL